jgi:hypothetical protein
MAMAARSERKFLQRSKNAMRLIHTSATNLPRIGSLSIKKHRRIGIAVAEVAVLGPNSYFPPSISQRGKV